MFEKPSVSKKSSHSILVVDDNHLIRKLIARAFELEAWRVTECNNAEDAMGQVLERATPFTAIVTDVKMPGMSGSDFVSALTQTRLRNDTILAVITGAANDLERTTIDIFEPDLFLEKPFEVDDLVSKVIELTDPA